MRGDGGEGRRAWRGAWRGSCCRALVKVWIDDDMDAEVEEFVAPALRALVGG